MNYNTKTHAKRSTKRGKISTFDFVNYAILICIIITILYPMLHVIAVSFSGSYEVMANQVQILPKSFNLEAYTYLFKNDKVMTGFINSVYYTFFGTLINLIFTLLMAYPLSRQKLIFRSTVIKMVVFTMFFSGGTIPTFLLVKDLKLLDSAWALWLPNAIWSMELLILISFFRSLPQSLFESAYLDGASEYRIFLQIALPLSKASIASIGMFYFMGHWNSYLIPLLYLNDSAKFPLQLILRSMLLEDAENITSQVAMIESTAMTPTSVKNAVIFITMIPVMLVYPFVQKYFVKGVMIGAIKG